MDGTQLQALIDKSNEANRLTITVSGDGWRAAASPDFDPRDDGVPRANVIDGGLLPIYAIGEFDAETVRDDIHDEFETVVGTVFDNVDDSDDPMDAIMELRSQDIA